MHDSVITARFHEKYIPEPNSGCWLWNGAVARGGYGVMATRDKSAYSAHRLSYEIHFGTIPSGPGYHGTCVCHKCDVAGCVNPAHLFLGTCRDNIADKVAKRRQARGERNGGHKHPVESVRLAMEMGKAGATLAQISQSTGISKTHVARILRRDVWRLLDERGVHNES